jgi:hypothetical protein
LDLILPNKDIDLQLDSENYASKLKINLQTTDRFAKRIEAEA